MIGDTPDLKNVVKHVGSFEFRSCIEGRNETGKHITPYTCQSLFQLIHVALGTRFGSSVDSVGFQAVSSVNLASVTEVLCELATFQRQSKLTQQASTGWKIKNRKSQISRQETFVRCYL